MGVCTGVTERGEELVLAPLHSLAFSRLLVVVTEDVEEAMDDEVGDLARDGPAYSMRLLFRYRQTDDDFTQRWRLVR